MANTRGLFVLAIAFSGFVAIADANNRAPRNFIMVIPDGFGPASETMARDYIHWTNNMTTSLPVDNYVIGQIRTRSSDSYVTDSAASATAYSCGIKTYNGAIGVDDSFQPCGTVLEAAKAAGFKTGLVVTSRITHATPAAYVAHVYNRDLEGNIALQEIGYTHPFGRQVDILMGGGKCFFVPKSQADSCRDDEVDALKIARENMGYSVFTDRAGFDTAQKLPYLGLFTNDHMSYELDRDPKVEPSLTEMALKALDDLHAATKKNKKGFFIMIEASRIDHAGHANDPAAHLHDILQYNTLMQTITHWIDVHHDNPTITISTADHECGGLTLGIQIPSAPEYLWTPEPLSRANSSTDLLSRKWKAYTGPDPDSYLKTLFASYGVADPTAQELVDGKALKSVTSAFGFVLAAALNRRLGVAFSTKGHSAVDVTLLGYGDRHREFVGNHENTEVVGFVERMLGVSVQGLTKRLRREKEWIGKWVAPPKPEIWGTVGKMTKREERRRGLLAMHHH